MISSVRGEVLEVALDHTVIEAGGVGYHVNATPSTLATLRHGGEARLITAMIVREDSQTLYGFPDRDTRDLFLTLLSVSGVGPRLAMATLAVHDGDSLRRLAVVPGMTGLWQVSGRSDLPWDEAVRLDLDYVDNWSLGLDARILALTVGAVLRHDGAY